jgi:flagellar basal body P-ring formation protein FlgA
MLRATGLLILWLILPTPAEAQVTGMVTGALPPTPALRRDITVTADLVRIGDLVDNAGGLASTPIFRAPDLGQTGTVATYRVIDAVTPYGLADLDTGGITEVVVRRATRTIAVKDIEAAVTRALAARAGATDPATLLASFDREPRPLHLDPGVRGELQASRIAFDPQSGRFDIAFELPDSIGRRSTLRYSGFVQDTVEVAVLQRPLSRGDLVKQGDIVTERRARSEYGNDTPVAAADVVGRAARRAMRVGQLLRHADLMKPEIVQRNEPVVLAYEAPGLMLTVRGKALETGAEGDLINVMNLQSKRTIQGIVTGAGRVTVATTTSAATVPRGGASQ